MLLFFSISHRNSIEIRKMEEPNLTREKIYLWFLKNGREFPWRDKNRTSYEVLVAEILLQRTTAKSVEKHYLNFLKKFPNFKAIENAELDNLHQILRDLGLMYKAKIFKKIAEQLRDNEYKIPKKKEKLLKLYGIGDYISSALLTFGFNFNTPIVDSNIRRFSLRFWNIKDLNLIKEKLLNLTMENTREVYFGLLDICWFYCRAPKPKCLDCPLISSCLKFNLV